MSESHIFSTGTLTLPSVLQPYTASRGVEQGTTGPTTPSGTSLANLSDSNSATTATCNSDTGGYEYFLLDLGAVYTIAFVVLANATVAAGGTLGVGVSTTGSAAGIPGNGSGAPAGTTTNLAASSGNVAPVTSQNLTFLPSGGTTVTGRYIYISYTGNPNPGSNVTLGGVVVNVPLAFALVQDCGIDVKFGSKDLFDAAQVATFAVDNGNDEGHWTLKITNASINPLALAKLIASTFSQVAAVTGPPAVPAQNLNTLPAAVTLPYVTAILVLTDTSGKTVTITLNNCKAQGVTLPFKLSDFVMQDFLLTAYPDASNILGTIVYQN